MYTRRLTNFCICNFLIILGIVLIFPVSAGNTELSGSTDDIVINAILPTSGDLKEQGIPSKTALELAVENLNSFYMDIGSNRNVSLKITEISSDPQSALSAVKKLHESGINLISGVFSSAQLKEIKPYADEHGVLILATGSSSNSLSIPGDNIYRFNPDDTSQGAALSSLLEKENISVIIPLVRIDLLDNLMNMTILGKSMNTTSPADIVLYNPEEEGYDTVVSRLDKLAGSVLADNDSKGVAVLAFTFDDIVQIMEEASEEQKYQNLTHVRFVGSDENTLSPRIKESQKAADFAIKHNLVGYTLYFSSDLVDPSVHNVMVEKLGYEPNGYVYASYDMGTIVALTEFLHASDGINELKKAVDVTSTQYRGILGTGQLNAAGDRVRTWYAFFRFEDNQNGKPEWKMFDIWEKLAASRSPALVNQKS
jgi:branched-chain amino acid transport system substrate-binding protein